VDAREIHEVAPVPLEPLVEAFRRAHAGGFEKKPSHACDYCEFHAACFPEEGDLLDPVR